MVEKCDGPPDKGGRPQPDSPEPTLATKVGSLVTGTEEPSREAENGTASLVHRKGLAVRQAGATGGRKHRKTCPIRMKVNPLHTSAVRPKKSSSSCKVKGSSSWRRIS